MERKPQISRRDFLKLTVLEAGSIVTAYGFGGWILNKLQEYQVNNDPPEGVDENFYNPEAANLPPQVAAKPTQASQNVENPGADVPDTVPEVKPLVDQYKIAEKIDLASGDPMKWLLITNDNKAILTPSAKPYVYSIENEQNHIFDWHNYTTYSYLEEHGLPVVWGHEGKPELFFDYWADALRKPHGGGYVSRAEAQQAMLEKIIGTTVYMFQSPDAGLLPDSPEKIGSMDPSVGMVEAQVVAGLFVPRWQKVSEIDKNGIPTDQSQITFDGSGFKVDFVTTWYNRHTMNLINEIKRIYPNDPRDFGQTQKLWAPLPRPNLVFAKFCMRRLADDLDAPDVDANGDSVIPASYGRFVMALEIKGVGV